MALDLVSTEMSIRQACVLGREQECSRAKYIERSSVVGGLSFGGMAGEEFGGVLYEVVR